MAAPPTAPAVGGGAAAGADVAARGRAEPTERAGGLGGAADAEAALAAYIDLVRQRIERQKRYPGLARSRHVEGTVLALVHLGAGGEVGSVEILESPSGLLSDPTREAILAAGPFPAPPGELRRIRIPIRYALD